MRLFSTYLQALWERNDFFFYIGLIIYIFLAPKVYGGVTLENEMYEKPYGKIKLVTWIMIILTDSYFRLKKWKIKYFFRLFFYLHLLFKSGIWGHHF